jgi:hypothetical protein
MGESSSPEGGNLFRTYYHTYNKLHSSSKSHDLLKDQNISLMPKAKKIHEIFRIIGLAGAKYTTPANPIVMILVR